MGDLLALAGRIEGLAGPDRDIDLAIALAIGAVDPRTVMIPNNGGFGFSERGSLSVERVRHYTALLDDAYATMPATYGWRLWVGASDRREQPRVTIWGPRRECAPIDVEAGLIPCAIIAAALRARAAIEAAGDVGEGA